jgi:acetyltransferase-like isoleucine patch superfamily enzyme
MKKENGKMLNEIGRLHKRLRNQMKRKWKRVLPFNEEITDRWEKADYLKFGRGTSIYDSAFVFGDVRVGERTWIGPFTVLDGTGGLEIGSNCSISTGVQIYTHDSVKWALSDGKQKYEYASVKIGNCCYIGSNVIISKGTVIGNRCVIGAGSFVNKNLPDNSIVFGVPAKVVGKVYERHGKIEFKYGKDKRN